MNRESMVVQRGLGLWLISVMNQRMSLGFKKRGVPPYSTQRLGSRKSDRRLTNGLRGPCLPSPRKHTQN
jgi:hypothetical protein